METDRHNPGDFVLYAADALIAVDVQRRILSMNSSAEVLTGYSEQEAIGQPCAEVLKSSICRGACPFERTFGGGEEITSFDVRIHNRFGEAIPVCINTSVLKNSHGEKVALVESVRDIRHILNLIADREAAATTLAAAVTSAERNLLLSSLRGARTTEEAAKRLGISRATLWRKMRKCGISLNRDIHDRSLSRESRPLPAHF